MELRETEQRLETENRYLVYYVFPAMTWKSRFTEYNLLTLYTDCTAELAELSQITKGNDGMDTAHIRLHWPPNLHPCVLHRKYSQAIQERKKNVP